MHAEEALSRLFEGVKQLEDIVKIFMGNLKLNPEHSLHVTPPSGHKHTQTVHRDMLQ